jgi:hypothetical protein
MPAASRHPSVAPEHCPRCLWTGKYEQLLVQNHDFYWYDPIPASRFSADEDYDCFCCSLLSGLLESQGICGRVDVQVRRSNGYLSLEEDNNEESKNMLVFTSSSTNDLATAQLPFLPHRRILSCDTSSADTLSWVQGEINACLSSHMMCRNVNEGFFPTRLLNVRSFHDSQDVVLVDGARLPFSSKYIALSHCWGKLRIQCLTKSTNLVQ